VLRSDVINVESSYVGMIAVRFTIGAQRWLRQQAIVQGNEHLYYIFNLTSPAGKGEPGADPVERAAVEAFTAMIDSVKLIDRSDIKREQDDRLFRTRNLFLYWTPQKFADLMVPKQYLRIIQEGKEVGYTYVEEMPNDPKLTGVDGLGRRCTSDRTGWRPTRRTTSG